MPEPYNRTQLRELRTRLDERWPRLPPYEADKWLPRFNEERSPYSRVRCHAVRLQVDCIVALALHLGLRRAQIFRLTVNDMHYDNAGAVLRDSSGSLDNAWEAPFTTVAWEACRDWLVCRSYLSPEHDRPWLNLNSAPVAREPMTVHTFNRLLSTYIGQECSFQRLRVTCAAGWVRSEMPLEHLRRLLGLSRIEDVLPYARLVRGSLEGEMAKLDTIFTDLVEPVRIAA